MTDDGGCARLVGMRVRSIALPSTSGDTLDLAALQGRTVVYCYPRTSRPGQPPLPNWDQIPGAKGCTPQSCAFRDQHAELRALGARVFGLSTQDTDYQREAVERLHLPFALLSDADLAFSSALRLPTFSVAGLTLIEHLTLILESGRIETVFHPVPAPEENAAQVVNWLRRAG